MGSVPDNTRRMEPNLWGSLLIIVLLSGVSLCEEPCAACLSIQPMLTDDPLAGEYRLIPGDNQCPEGCSYTKDGDPETWCFKAGPYTADTCAAKDLTGPSETIAGPTGTQQMPTGPQDITSANNVSTRSQDISENPEDKSTKYMTTADAFAEITPTMEQMTSEPSGMTAGVLNMTTGQGDKTTGSTEMRTSQKIS